MHEAVMALVRARLSTLWKVKYGEAVVEASLGDFLTEIRETVAKYFKDSWVSSLVQRFTNAAVQAAQRNFQIELRRALRSLHPGGDLYVPRGNLDSIIEARVLAQVQEIKSIPEKYVTEVTRMISNAAITGIPYSDLEDQLEDLIGMAESRAHTIAVTEIGRVYSEAMFDRYDQLEVEHVIWVTADDERTCEECAPLDGRRFTVDQAHDMLPVHPNCRCTVIADPDELRASAP